MSLYITSLNSGSNGNCYYIANDNEAILVDVGISCRETEKRMLRLGLPMEKIKAIFISHEHSDHIRGVEVISRKYKLPVYITPNTLKHSGLKLNEELVRSFTSHESVSVGELSVIPFSKFHDAADPFSFIVEGNNIKIGVFTDIGSVCENLIHYFKQCNAAFLETNYDVQMLETGGYPYYLKKRISGEKGHLSNDQALELFKKHKPLFLDLLLLSHLSKDNNDPRFVKELFLKHAGKTNIVVASRNEETAVFKISGENIKLKIRKNKLPEAAQMSLLF